MNTFLSFSMKRAARSLALVGAYPPPNGGVGTHMRRLCELLDRRGIDYVVYNTVSEAGDSDRVISVSRNRIAWFLQYALFGREPVVYIMSHRLSTWMTGALMSILRGKQVLLRLQNSQLLDWQRSAPWRRLGARWALRHVNGVVCVNQALAETVQSLGVDAARVRYQPGFLPPSQSDRARESVAPSVWSYVEAHHPLLAANGNVSFHDRQDLYGLDMLVELAARLRPDYPTLGIVVCFWHFEADDQAYLDQLQRRAASLGVKDNIFFNTVEGYFVPVIEASTVFVRPTNTDGDASSIREALHLGVPAVVSDAAARPEGSVLFRSRDVRDFEAKVRAVLEESMQTTKRRKPGLSAPEQERIEGYIQLLSTLAQRSCARAGR